MSALPLPIDPPDAREALAAPAPTDVSYAAVRRASEAIAARLSPEECQVQSMPDASPVKWHLAHTTWFFETFVLERAEDDFRPFDPAFRVLFNSYYEAVGARHPRPQRGLLTSPSLAEVLRYRAGVDARMQRLLAGSIDADTAGLVTLGLHHEQQHQELMLTDVKHALSFVPWREPIVPPRPAEAAAAPTLRWLRVAGGLVDIGHDAAQDGEFAFDNEGPRHRQWLEPFELASRPATNAEFLAFIDDGGYRRPELWLSLGWDWVQSGGHEAPLYWRRDEAGAWLHHTLQGEQTPDLAAPVCHLSFFEADAFARWSHARLPTEAEWEHAVRALGAAPCEHDNDAAHGAWHPLPASHLEASAPPQCFGDVWEWTSSSYAPYPGFRPAPGAVGEYNGKFMCSQMVLRGGSCATPRGHVRTSYRNFFPPQAQWQFSGVRLARDARTP